MATPAVTPSSGSSGLKRNVIIFVAVLVIGGAAMWAWKTYYTKADNVVKIASFDQFQQALAQQAQTSFNVDPASVVIAPMEYDVGTLLEQGHSTPSDESDCVPKPVPGARSAGHLFPAYQLDSQTAGALNLGSDALQQLTTASLNLAHSSDLVYSIDNVTVTMMDLKQVQETSMSGACGDWVRTHPGLRMIRGVVQGKISFSVKAADPSTLAAKLPQMAGVSASVGDSSTLSVADSAPTQILDLVAVVEAPPNTQAPQAQASVAMPPPPPPPAPVRAMPAPVGAMPAHHRAVEAETAAPVATRAGVAAQPVAASVAPPPPGGWVAHIFFQADQATDPKQSAQAVAALRANWPGALVEAQVQRIPTARMPGTAQIRFFNDADAGVAAKCHDRLKASTGIDAKVVRVGLQAPQKQLEVWLPKAGA